MSASDTVSVIIVTFNSLPAVVGCLRYLKEASREVAMQVVVVDNGSTDGTVAAVRQEMPNADVICNDKNHGFGFACNQGMTHARGEYLLFLNPDVELDPEAIIHLLAVARSTRNAGLIAGRLRYPDGRFQANCRKFPTVTNLLFSRGSLPARLLLNRLAPKSTIYSLPDYDEVTAVPAVAATLVLVRRDLFKKIRGFDTRFFLYMEDSDLSLRLHYSGFVNLFVPQAGGVHGFGRGAKIGRVKRSWYQHHAVWQYFLKHFPNGFSLFLLPALLIVNFLLSAMVPSPRSR